KKQLKKAEKRGREDRAKPRLETFAGHDKAPRKADLKRKLEVSRLKRAAAKQEELLRNYIPPKVTTPECPESRRRRRRQDFYDLDTSKWQLRGAARPAPIIGAEPENPHWQEQGEDLFALKGEAFSSHPACRTYLDLKCQLGGACLAAGKSKDAIQHFERCLVLDPSDAVRARRGLVRALMDRSLADRARALIERFRDTDTGAVLSWSLVAIEYISWRLLGEDGSDEAVAAAALEAAYAANPFVAWQLAFADEFADVLEYVDDIRDPAPSTVEEAFQYCSWEAALWQDLEGAAEWIAGWLIARAAPAPQP
ncbi:hypothetical protein JKP88DRAFT_150685, partial [Tribonema minus]